MPYWPGMPHKESKVSLHTEPARGALSLITRQPDARPVATLLVSEWVQALRQGQPLSLMVVSVDHLRLFVRQHGEAKAQLQVDAITAALDLTARRARDVAGRCSADAFMVLLPGTPADGAKAVAERCLQNVRAALAEQLLSVSLGVGTVIPRSEAGHSTFFNAVAQLCDEASSKGGDRWVARHFGHSRTGIL